MWAFFKSRRDPWDIRGLEEDYKVLSRDISGKIDCEDAFGKLEKYSR